MGYWTFHQIRNEYCLLCSFNRNFYFHFSIKDILATFKEIENDGTGQVDIEKLWDKLKERKTPSGRNFEETELEQLIKASAGDEKQIDVIKFVNLIIRMKQFRG